MKDCRYDIDDFKVIKRIGKKAVVKCKICGREQTLSSLNVFTKRNNSHGNICSKILLSEYGGKSNIKIKQFYSIWCNIKNRTNNPNYEKWERYGGRGIKSEEFNYFIDFYDRMFNSYCEHVLKFGENDTTIDRIDNDKDYNSENCRWVTWDEQAKNKSSIIEFEAISPNGIKYVTSNLKEFCENNELIYEKVYAAVHTGVKNSKSFNGWIFNLV